ncbi:hypothetical protein ACFXPN_05850 [Streptomyces griseorubiginosus]|uniref:hypothetical protein n=1 Tax=Streptomyces griseorubiginosus TaxID=67304 RepID=UPI0036D01814
MPPAPDRPGQVPVIINAETASPNSATTNPVCVRWRGEGVLMQYVLFTANDDGVLPTSADSTPTGRVL